MMHCKKSTLKTNDLVLCPLWWLLSSWLATSTSRYASAHVLQRATVRGLGSETCLQVHKWLFLVPWRISSIRSIECAATNHPACFHPQSLFVWVFLLIIVWSNFETMLFFIFLLKHDFIIEIWVCLIRKGMTDSQWHWGLWLFGLKFFFWCCEDACSRTKTVHFYIETRAAKEAVIIYAFSGHVFCLEYYLDESWSLVGSGFWIFWACQVA